VFPPHGVRNARSDEAAEIGGSTLPRDALKIHEHEPAASIEEHVVGAEVEMGECARWLGEKLKDPLFTPKNVATDTQSMSVEAAVEACQRGCEVFPDSSRDSPRDLPRPLRAAFVRSL
jgi:hypothetical protein